MQLCHLSTILGPPSSIVDLTAEQQECSIFISWEPPYLLPGLSVSYKVHINGEMNISTTNYTYYYPMKLTNTTYNVTVKAFNDSIIGENSDTLTDYQVGKINL